MAAAAADGERFPYILGEAGKQVEDKNSHYLFRAGLALVISSQPKKYNSILYVQGEGFTLGTCGSLTVAL